MFHAAKITSENTDKGFNASLFDCINNTLVSTLGEDAIESFYRAIEMNYNFPQELFETTPLGVLQDLKDFLGVGYGILEVLIRRGIRAKFKVQENGSERLELTELIEVARKNFLLESVA
jgi:hypothetical protein